MIDVYLIIFIILICILFKCNLLTYEFIKSLSIKSVITNILFILPIITMYLEHDNISNIFSNINKSKNNRNNSINNRNNSINNRNNSINNRNNSINNRNNSKNNNSRRNLNETTKKVVAANQKWTCNMCYKMLDASYEIDHTIPLYKGGNNNIENLQALCRNCHGLKTINDKLMNTY